MNADDKAFDLLRVVADHAEAVGLDRTAQLVEAAMDALLEETGRLDPEEATPWKSVRGSGVRLSSFSMGALAAPERRSDEDTTVAWKSVRGSVRTALDRARHA